MPGLVDRSFVTGILMVSEIRQLAFQPHSGFDLYRALDQRIQSHLPSPSREKASRTPAMIFASNPRRMEYLDAAK